MKLATCNNVIDRLWASWRRTISWRIVIESDNAKFTHGTKIRTLALRNSLQNQMNEFKPVRVNAKQVQQRGLAVVLEPSLYLVQKRREAVVYVKCRKTQSMRNIRNTWERESHRFERPDEVINVGDVDSRCFRLVFYQEATLVDEAVGSPMPTFIVPFLRRFYRKVKCTFRKSSRL